MDQMTNRYTCSGFPVLCATYRSRVAAQHYVDGKPSYREEAIGKWGPQQAAYFESEATLRDCFDLWGRGHTWEYQILRSDWVGAETLPYLTLVHVSITAHWLTDNRARRAG